MKTSNSVVESKRQPTKPHIKLSHTKKPKPVDPDRVYFFHIRFTNKDGELSVHSGKTFAAKVVGDEIHYVCASCSHKDHFCKRIGRMVAEGRLKKGKEVFVFPTNNIRTFAEAVFTNFS